jgi:hypothetical protein
MLERNDQCLIGSLGQCRMLTQVQETGDPMGKPNCGCLDGLMRADTAGRNNQCLIRLLGRHRMSTLGVGYGQSAGGGGNGSKKTYCQELR